EHDVKPGETLVRIVTVALERPPLAVGNVRWLFVPSGEYIFPIVVSYSDPSGVRADPENDLAVSFEAPFSVLIIGALAGAFIVGILRTWMMLLQTHRAGQLNLSIFFRRVGAFVGLQLPVSLLIAILAIVLAKISTEFRGVLRIELSDFWAGFLVGVLAQSTTGPIAEALGRVVGGVQPNGEPGVVVVTESSPVLSREKE